MTARRLPVAYGTRVVLALLFALVAAHEPAHAQGRRSVDREDRQIREAISLEGSQRYPEAEVILRDVLATHPTSFQALFVLERVLRASGVVREILPYIDAFLERRPDSPDVRRLELEVLAQLREVARMRARAETWLEVDGHSELTYLEIARIYEFSLGASAAHAFLEEGRAHVSEGWLPLAIGDLSVKSGDDAAAAREWASAVRANGEEATEVSRRIAALEGGVERVGREVLRLLGSAPEAGRRAAAGRIAIDLGLEGEALDLNRGIAGALEGLPRSAFLSEVAQHASDKGLVRVAEWAYAELAGSIDSPVARRQFEQRIVEVALEAGDTAVALNAQERLAASFAPGEPERRRELADLLRMRLWSGDPDALVEGLQRFREEFPDAEELDELAASISGALRLMDPESRDAGMILEGVDGPRSSLQRAYLLLRGGEVEEGKDALMLGLRGVRPEEATEVIQLIGLLERLSPEGARVLGRAAALNGWGRPLDGAGAIEAEFADVPGRDQAALLAEGARMADRGGDAEAAARMREVVLERYPDAPEVGEVTLALARYHAGRPGGAERAIEILEELIVTRPGSAVAPNARVELERLRRGRS